MPTRRYSLPSVAMNDTTILLLVLVGSLAVAMFIAWLLVRSGRSKAEEQLAPLGPTEQKVAATALGRSDDAEETLTGTGTLVVTATELAFAQWRPSRLLRIDRADIVSVDTRREHLGRTMKRDVLRVAWKQGGVEESVAFFVRDLDPWLVTLSRRSR